MMRCQRCPFFIVLPCDFPYLSIPIVLKGQQVEGRREPRETDWSGATALNGEINLFVSVPFLRVLCFIVQHKKCLSLATSSVLSWNESFKTLTLELSFEIWHAATPTIHLLIVSKSRWSKKIVFFSLSLCLWTTQFSVNHRTFRFIRTLLTPPKDFY